jgi:hypothetical protein
MSKDDGGPAFPIQCFFDDGSRSVPIEYGQPGMTLRDYFAGQALAGFLAAPGRTGEKARDNSGRAAYWAYVQADAMLEARKT